MYIIIVIMLTGTLVGFLLRNQRKIIKPIEPIINWSIYLLLFLLGISVGTNEIIINNLDKIGLNAFILTIGAVMGSIVTSYVIYICFFNKNEK